MTGFMTHQIPHVQKHFDCFTDIVCISLPVRVFTGHAQAGVTDHAQASVRQSGDIYLWPFSLHSSLKFSDHKTR